ncbi:hypothetical protein ACIPW5_09050 [Streptomyces sp. NPDC090077]|uniref:hypothetical protein n=1 Tax=Streptomyces sp. NPDC090077 TaxID=3365938 RepID=UPI00382DA2FE
MGRPLYKGTRAALAALACGAFAAGCAQERGGATAPPPPGPKTTTAAAPPEAAAVAERYRAAGGDPDVSGIRQEATPDGVPLLIVWTRNPSPEARIFDKQAASIPPYLAAAEGLRLERGYRINVYGPQGTAIHQMDATP